MQENKLAFLKRDTFVNATVDGNEVKFYPVSVASIANLKLLEGKVLGNLAVLFSKGNENDCTSQSRERKIGDEVTTDYGREAINPELAAFRSKEKKEAVSEIVDGLFQGKSLESLAELVVSSLRAKMTGKELLEESNPNQFIEMVKGMIAANAKVLSPFFQMLEKMLLEKIQLPSELRQPEGITNDSKNS